MNLAAWCLRNTRTAGVLFFLVALAGVATFFTIPKKENPDFTIRTATVITRFPGATPKRVEELVTDVLEQKIRELPEVETVLSQSMSGVSVITVEVFEKYTDMDPIWQDLRNKVDDAAPGLPPGVPPPLVNDSYGDVFGILVALTGDGYSYREMEDAAKDLRDGLLHLDTVAKVELWGVQEERIFVDFSNARLAEYGYSPFLMAQLIEAQNTIQPSGHARVGPERIVIEPTGEFADLEDLRRMSLRPPGLNHSIALSDIAEISRGFVDPPDKMVRYNGERSILLAVSMAEGGNIVALGERVRARLNAMRANLPIGLDDHVLVFQPRFVEDAIGDFMLNLGEAFVFVVIVMLLFAGLRTGLIAAALVPMAMLACVAVMPFFDVALQTISIASLIISLGILVDNGVVVSEDILVRLASGQERDTAVTRAVSELWKPLLAASLTTIFAFLPIPLAQSTTGEYTGSLFIVVSLTLLASWLLSMSLVPMLAHRFLKARITAQDFSGRAYRVYRGLLMACLRHRAVFLVLAVAVLAGAFWTMRHVPSMFFPPNERNMFIIDFWQPYGTDIRVTEERAAALEDFLLAQEAVDSTGVFVGTGGPRWYLPLSLEEDNRNYAFLVVNTRTVEDVEPVMRRTRAHAAEHFPDARATVKELMHGPPVGAPIQIRLSGEDIPTLYRLRERVGAMLEGTEGVSHVWDDWGQWTKKLVVDVNQDQARRVGLSSYDIALSLQAQMSGVTASQFREGDDLIPIVVRSQEAFREDLGRIEGLNVYSYQEGTSVPLLQVARTRLEWQPPNIRRRDQQRTITVKAEVRGRFASAVLADVRPQLEQMQAGQDWPMGYRVDYGGEFEESSQANASIMALVPLAMGLLVLVLVSQFNSLRRPAIILLTIPFMFAGIAPGMLLTNSPFGFMALLGVISLTGIIVNNAIMLIDRVESLAAEGHVRREAVVLSAMQRARPILMTTVTTIVGMIPLSLQGGEMWRPMANCIISGLAVSTLLTLLLCPVLYSLFFRLRYRDYRWDPAAARGQ